MIKVDVRGMVCPMPVIKAKETIEIHPKEEIEVWIDNLASKENVKRFLQSKGWQVEEEKGGENIFIVKGIPATMDVSDQVIASPQEQERQKILVIISNDKIGQGDDKLGKALMKNFIATLKEMGDDLWRIILLNGGVKLAIQDSEHLPELHYLTEQGVDVFVFGLLEKKAIGITTNMLDIIIFMQLATKVVCL
jgi:selenium metabolism protein YedF